MNQLQIFDRSHPQTLQISVMLGYIVAVLELLLNGARNVRLYLEFGLSIPGGLSDVGALAVVICMGAGAFYVANNRHFGWAMELGAVGVWLAGLVATMVCSGQYFQLEFLFDLLFLGALVAALVHQQTQEYRKIWFS